MRAADLTLLLVGRKPTPVGYVTASKRWLVFRAIPALVVKIPDCVFDS